MGNLCSHAGQIMFSKPGHGPGALIIDLQNMYACVLILYILVYIYTFIKLLDFFYLFINLWFALYIRGMETKIVKAKIIY